MSIEENVWHEHYWYGYINQTMVVKFKKEIKESYCSNADIDYLSDYIVGLYKRIFRLRYEGNVRIEEDEIILRCYTDYLCGEVDIDEMALFITLINAIVPVKYITIRDNARYSISKCGTRINHTLNKVSKRYAIKEINNIEVYALRGHESMIEKFKARGYPVVGCRTEDNIKLVTFDVKDAIKVIAEFVYDLAPIGSPYSGIIVPLDDKEISVI